MTAIAVDCGMGSRQRERSCVLEIGASPAARVMAFRAVMIKVAGDVIWVRRTIVSGLMA